MWEVLSSPLAQRGTLALIHFLWQGLAVAALLALLLRSFHRPRARYALGVSALILMALLPVATCAWVELPRSGELSFVPGATVRGADQAADGIASVSTESSDAPAPPSWSLAQVLEYLQPGLLACWLGGALLLHARLLSAWLGTIWLRGDRADVHGPLAARVEAIGRKLGIDAAGRVFGSARVREAAAVGLWQPIVLVPLSWLTELPTDVLEAVIAHELAHLRRHDLWVTWLQRLIESVLFYHPAVWWVSRQVSLAREMCCDELAVTATGGRGAYARALEIVGRRAAGESSLVLATSFHGDADMNLLKRVRGVLGLKPQRESGLAWSAGLLLLAVGMGMALALAGREARAQREEGQKDRPAAEAEPRRSAEAEQGARRSPEAEAGARRSAEGDAPRRSAEGAGRPRRPAEGNAPADRPRERAPREGGDDPLRGFRPQNDREAVLLEVIRGLQQQLNELRMEVRQMRGGGDRPRDGEGVRRGPRDGEGEVRRGPRDGEGPPRPGPRDGEGTPRRGPRDGEGAPKAGPREGEKDAPRGERDPR